MKRNPIFYLLCAAGLVLILGAWTIYRTVKVSASDNVVTRSYELSGFDGIKVGGSMDVTFVAGDWGVEIETHDNFFDYLEVDVEGRKLRIMPQPMVQLKNQKTFNVRISCPELKTLDASGAVAFHFPEGISGKSLVVKMSGSTALDFARPVIMRRIEVKTSGLSKVSFADIQAVDADIAMSGSSRLDVAEVKCTNLEMELSGVASCTLAGEAVNADLHLSGSSSMDACGFSCSNMQAQTSGLAKIQR